MYYEEQNIGGILHYRHTSNGKWIKMTEEQMTKKILSLKAEVSRLTNTQ
jgi:hypothetical protein